MTAVSSSTASDFLVASNPNDALIFSVKCVKLLFVIFITFGYLMAYFMVVNFFIYIIFI